MNDIDFSAMIIAKLFILCSPQSNDYHKVFAKMRGHLIGDYMGSGYPFVDAFNRIYDEYAENVSESFHEKVKKCIDELKSASN